MYIVRLGFCRIRTILLKILCNILFESLDKSNFGGSRWQVKFDDSLSHLNRNKLRTQNVEVNNKAMRVLDAEHAVSTYPVA